MIISTTGNDENKNQALTIDDNSFVGVGTTSPSAKLQVNGGDIRLSATDGDNPYTFRSYSNAGSLWFMPNLQSGGNFSNKDPHLVIADAHNWDRSISIKYDLETTIDDATGVLEIGQLVQNGGNGYTHGETHFRTNGEKRVPIKSNGCWNWNNSS